MSQKTHVMHGRDHLPGGADPIPLLPPVSGGYVTQVLAHPHLVHYWRMGAADGNQPDLSVDAGQPYGKDLIPDSTYPTGVYDVTGALPEGDDDGAFEFNGGGVTATTWFHTASTAPPHRANFAGNAPFTIECWAWINPFWGISTSHDAGLGALVCMASSVSVYWSLEVYATTDDGPPEFTEGPSGRLRLKRDTSGEFTVDSVGTGVWRHIVATYDGTTSRVYLDGGLWYSEINLAGIATSSSETVRVGFRSITPYNAYFWGMVDEVALYDIHLSAAEVLSHYQAARGGDAGEVLTVDDGGTLVWQKAELEVTY